MKRINLLSLTMAACLTFFAFSTALAQEEMPPQTDAQNFQNEKRPRIMEELGLSREQVQQIRRIYQERKFIMQDAQRNWREAQRSLDTAIYSDSATEDEIKTRVREAQEAHAHLIKERVTTEYMIRRVLTPDQLQKFRDLRAQFRPGLKNPQNQNNPQQRPFKRLQPRRQNRQQPNF